MDELNEPPPDADAPPLAQVEHWPEGQGRTVKITGELDLSCAESVRRELDGITATQPSVLVFDLSRLRFIDSSGLTVLVTAAEVVPSVRIRNPTPAVRRIIEVTGLDQTLPVEP